MHVRQAIQTKYIAPTNTRGARVKAWCQAKSIYVSWDDRFDVDENHYAAASQLREIMRWPTHEGFGALPGGGYAMTLPVTE